MLQSIRERIQGWASWVVVFLIVMVFIFWGMAEYFKAGPSDELAKVNGVSISRAEVELQVERMMRAQKEPLLAGQNKERLGSQALENLIQMRVLQQGADHLGLKISETQMEEVIQQVLELKKLPRRAFYEDLRRGLLLNQLQQIFVRTSFSLKTEFDSVLAMMDQHRDVGSMIIALAPFKKAEEASLLESDLQAYYDQKKEAFYTEEAVKLEYIHLSAEEVDKAEDLSTLAFEQPETLVSAASSLGLPLKKTDWIDRHTADPILGQAVVMNLIFGEDALSTRKNTPLVNLEGDQAVVLRVLDYRPAERQSFAQVRDEIRQILLTEKAMHKAQVYAQTLVERIRKGEKGAHLAREQGLVWNVDRQVNRQVFDARYEVIAYAFSLPRPTQARYSVGSLLLNSGDLCLVQVLSVEDGTSASLSTEQVKLIAQGLSQNLGEFDFEVYAMHLLATSKIKR